MTTYYISISHGAVGSGANKTSVTEGTSAPTADVYVAIGASTPVSLLSRSEIRQKLKALVNWVESDGKDPGANAAATIPFGYP